MFIVTSDGLFPAIWGPGLFTAIDSNEYQSMQGAGIKMFKVRNAVYWQIADSVNNPTKPVTAKLDELIAAVTAD